MTRTTRPDVANNNVHVALSAFIPSAGIIALITNASASSVDIVTPVADMGPVSGIARVVLSIMLQPEIRSTGGTPVEPAHAPAAA
ncbi:hypothetical protein [Burkholderia cenocepacia]|uniref:hypothetical protein n=1 Tax=Burkholderia cenocepacia TaxID=95486 RepID=UPI00209A6B1D|nr:hypothetical protein [Burkholderia cenocepacia]